MENFQSAVFEKFMKSSLKQEKSELQHRSLGNKNNDEMITMNDTTLMINNERN